jgi:molecular chaperone DnaJ
VNHDSWPPIESIASQVWSSFARTEVRPQEPLRSLNVQIILSPDEAASGGIASIPIPVFYPCATCGGSGREGVAPCTSCDAHGMSEEEETVRIHIPALVEDYRCVELPVRGLGLHNLYLRVYIRVER